MRGALAALARERLAGRGRPVPAPNLHLTLVFLGAVEPASRERLEAACAGIAVAPFTLSLSRLGCWPRSRVAWSAPERAPRALERLVDRLRAAASLAGIAVEARPFRAHVTLARGIDPGPALAGAHRPIRWEAGAFTLVRSRTHSDGSRYQTLATWPASAGRDG